MSKLVKVSGSLGGSGVRVAEQQRFDLNCGLESFIWGLKAMTGYRVLKNGTSMAILSKRAYQRGGSNALMGWSFDLKSAHDTAAFVQSIETESYTLEGRERNCARPSIRTRVGLKGVVSPWPVRSRRVWTIGFVLALLYACVLSQPGHAASDCSGVSSASPGVLPSSQTNPPKIVVGFLGGFVRHDEPHHPEVQLIQDLRQDYPKDVYFGLFENRKVGVAYHTILKLLGTTEGDALSDDKKRRARIVLFGHSWGASAVVSLSRKLERAGIPVTLTIQIDSVAKPFQNDWLIPANVLEAVNFYQTHGLIQGRQKIVPADPAHTTILGNFLWEYKGEPAECYGFSWRGRLLSKGHTQIECDQKVWLQVKALLGSILVEPSGTQTDAGEPALLSSRSDRNGSQQR
jgi:hypothetical protein